MKSIPQVKSCFDRELRSVADRAALAQTLKRFRKADCVVRLTTHEYRLIGNFEWWYVNTKGEKDGQDFNQG